MGLGSFDDAAVHVATINFLSDFEVCDTVEFWKGMERYTFTMIFKVVLCYTPVLKSNACIIH